MRLMTQIGEASALVDGKEYLVRPTFAALSSLGAPSDIDYHIKNVCSAYTKHLDLGIMPQWYEVASCAAMLEACSNLPSEWMGHVTEARRSGVFKDAHTFTKTAFHHNFKWVQTKLTIHELIVMAHHCVKWGVSGKPKWTSKPKKEARPTLFDPQEFVAMLIDEFHVSRNDAWAMTMTEFQRLCELREKKAWAGKTPPPTHEEAKKSLEYANDAIKRARELGIKGKKMGRSR